MNTEKESSHTFRWKAEAPLYGSSETRAIRSLSNKMTVGNGLERCLEVREEQGGAGITETGGNENTVHSATDHNLQKHKPGEYGSQLTAQLGGLIK